MIGGIFMSYALFKKIKYLYKKYEKIFFPELLYSFIILSIIPLVFYNFELEMFKYIFYLTQLCFLILFP